MPKTPAVHDAITRFEHSRVVEAIRLATATNVTRWSATCCANWRWISRSIGRIENNAFVFDFRCLEDESAFARNLSTLRRRERH
jgi:hypothetical protein